MLTINEQLIQKFIDSDEQLTSLYQISNRGNPTSEKFLRERVTNCAQSIFNIAHEQALKGNLCVIFNNKPFFNSSDKHTLPLEAKDLSNTPVTNTAFNSYVKKMISQIFNHHLDMNLKFNESEIILNWDASNPHFNLKPILKKQFLTANVRGEYFKSLLSDPTLADTKINVRGNIFSLHKVLLSQSPTFKKMFENEWKESFEGVSFDAYELEAFKAVLKYLYKGKISSDYFLNIDQTLELYSLSDFLVLPNLKEICVQQIYDKIDEESFIQIALLQKKFEDGDLKKLCEWYLCSYPPIVQSLDLCEIEMTNLLLIYDLGTAYNSKPLQDISLNQIENIVELNDDFINLCQKVETTKDSILKSCLIKALKQKPPLLEKLKKDRKGLYEKHWEAYCNVMTDLNF